MAQMFKVGSLLFPPEELREIEVRDNGEVVVRRHGGTVPLVCTGAEAKEVLAQIEPAAIPRDKVVGLKEMPPPAKPASAPAK